MSNVKVIRGFLPDALSEGMPKRIAFLHMDLNSPTAEIGVLEIHFDLVVPGGFIVFDDFGWNMYGPLREAEVRFMQKRGPMICELPTGQGLIIKH